MERDESVFWDRIKKAVISTAGRDLFGAICGMQNRKDPSLSFGMTANFISLIAEDETNKSNLLYHHLRSITAKLLQQYRLATGERLDIAGLIMSDGNQLQTGIVAHLKIFL